MNEGVRSRRSKLWSEKGHTQLESLSLAPWTTRRRTDLLELLDRLDNTIHRLTQAVEDEAVNVPEVQLLITHPGVGPLTVLSFVLTLGQWERFRSGKHVASYLGLAPTAHSSGGYQRLGHISKQGNSLMRFLLDEAAHVAVRCSPEWRQTYMRLSIHRDNGIARTALARKLAVHLYWMLRKKLSYEHMQPALGSHAR
jgi:transposase